LPSISALTLACTEHENDLDESEALLNRAIAMVRGPARTSPPVEPYRLSREIEALILVITGEVEQFLNPRE
jgi:hypothetical protein